MRVLITGASCSGTSTLAKAISDQNGWDFFDADDYFWISTHPPYQQRRSYSQRLAMLLADLNTSDNAVVAGSIMDWGCALEDSFDLVVFLYLDTEIRVERAKKREIDRQGYVNDAFIKWLSEYDIGPSEGRSLARHNEWLSKRDCQLVRLEGDLSVEERLDIVNKYIS